MPRRRDPLLEPREYMAGDWPNGVVNPGAPLPVHYLRDIVFKMQARMDDLGINSNDLAKITNLDRSTMRYMLTGRAWPDMVTLAKIEQGLEVTLWPNWGDGELRDAQTRIIELEDQIRRLRSNARKKAAAGRVAPVRAGAAATKKRAAARTPRKR